jgi:hypothetical protein
MFAQTGFERHLSPDVTNMVSTCKYCGYQITVSVREGLEEREREHQLTCRKVVTYRVGAFSKIRAEQ